MLKQVQHDGRCSGLDPESVQGDGWPDPESTFVASACECGVAVQGDGFLLWGDELYSMRWPSFQTWPDAETSSA